MRKMYNVGDYVVIPESKEIKQILEIEVFDNDCVFYMTDGSAHGIGQCKTVSDEYNEQVNKLAEKWKI